MRHLLTVPAAALLSISSAAFAQAPGEAGQKARPAPDQNEIVCEKQGEPGSRIASKRVCKTRAEWAEERRSNRMDIDKAQTLRGTNSPQ